LNFLSKVELSLDIILPAHIIIRRKWTDTFMKPKSHESNKGINTGTKNLFREFFLFCKKSLIKITQPKYQVTKNIRPPFRRTMAKKL
jgi:hypothetical protein